eukprot:EG_transcript_1730
MAPQLQLQPYSEDRYRPQVAAALQCIRTVLDRSRTAQPLGDVPHQYGDKYAVAEGLTTALLAALLDLLGFLGVPRETFRAMVDWAKEGTVTLRLTVDEKCDYRGEKTREVQCGFGMEHHTVLPAFFRKTSHKLFQTVKDHEWGLAVTCTLAVYPGNDPTQAVPIEEWREHATLHTKAKVSPRPEAATRTMEVQLTPLFDFLGPDHHPAVRIDRSHPLCRTPRRNPAVEAALAFGAEVAAWGGGVLRYFADDVLAAANVSSQPFEALWTEPSILPVVPVLVGDGAAEEAAAVPTAEDAAAFLAAFRHQVQQRLEALGRTFPQVVGEEGGLSLATARFLTLTVHALLLFQGYSDAVDSVEDLLRKQLVAAVGHEVQPPELAACMQFHFWRLLRAEYRLEPFAYPVRRPGGSLQGTLAVEAALGPRALPQPIQTITRSYDSRDISFPLSAAAKVCCRGTHFVHAFVAHRFSSDPMPELQLLARARQCCGFVLVVGRLQDKAELQPLAACIVQNQEELRIPLLLEPLPTPKEFRDAIVSLSPEQREFARAIRSMQLEGTVFGVLAIPIVPALEAVLGLQPDALTKEVQLTRDLMALFIEHQIPSDLLAASDAGQPISDPAKALRAVQHSVDSMRKMLDAARHAELTRAREEAAARRLQTDRREAAPVPPPEPPAPQPRTRVQEEVDFVRELMTANIEKILQRGECLDQLADKRDVLVCDGVQFRAAAPKSGRNLGLLGGLAKLGQAVAMPAFAPRPPPFAPTIGGATLHACVDTCSAATSSGSATPPHRIEPAPPQSLVVQQEVQAPIVLADGVGPATPPPAVGSPEAAAGPSAGEAPSSVPPAGDDAPTSPPDAGPAGPGEYTQLPVAMEARLADLDVDHAVRPTTVTPGSPWQFTGQHWARAAATARPIPAEEQPALTAKAMDLLDALSRCGALPLGDAQLHVFLAVTHCFDKTLLEVVVQDSVNPIAAVERTGLIVASVVHATAPATLLHPTHVPRLTEQAAHLFQ